MRVCCATLLLLGGVAGERLHSAHSAAPHKLDKMTCPQVRTRLEKQLQIMDTVFQAACPGDTCAFAASQTHALGDASVTTALLVSAAEKMLCKGGPSGLGAPPALLQTLPKFQQPLMHTYNGTETGRRLAETFAAFGGWALSSKDMGSELAELRR